MDPRMIETAHDELVNFCQWLEEHAQYEDEAKADEMENRQFYLEAHVIPALKAELDRQPVS